MNTESVDGSKPELKPEGFQEQLENLREIKKSAGAPGGGSAYRLSSTLSDLEAMAAGENPEGIREEYYPGWKDSDFKKLLEEFAK